jgi:hypothetical protein
MAKRRLVEQKERRYVNVYARGYSHEFSSFVSRDFKHFGIKSDGGGYMFTTDYQDVGGVAPDVETAKAARDYFKLFPGVKASCQTYFDYVGAP